jgi:hypothetical protein
MTYEKNRTGERFPAQLPARIAAIGDQRGVVLKTLNISTSGVLLATEAKHMPVGSRVAVKLGLLPKGSQVENGSICFWVDMKGTITRYHEDSVAIQFLTKCNVSKLDH